MGARSENEVLGQEPQFAAFVGLDWADQKHAWCLQAAGATQRENGEVEHTPETVEAWVGQLCRSANMSSCICFPVPPAMSASMRDALYPSGGKDDPRDAELLLDLLMKHRDKLRLWRPIAKPPVGYKIWWRRGATWWTKRRRKPIG